MSAQENIEVKISRLQKKIIAPVITGLALDWGGAEVSSVYPKNPGDLYAGTQLMIAGRYAKEGEFEVTLTGRAGEQSVEIRQKIAFPEERDASEGVPYLWAMRKITDLLDGIRRHGENTEARQQVIALSRQYRISTPYTSFLVLETEGAYDQYGIDRHSAGANPPQPVFRKDANATDHNESDDAVETASLKGHSMDFTSDKPFKGNKVYDTIGGGGGGARFGGRFGGKRNLVATGGGSGATEDSVLAALRWLARHQSPDGSWSLKGLDETCAGTGDAIFDAGVTGLSLLAFLGSGYSHLSKDTYDGIYFGDVVHKGMQWVMRNQDPEGCIGDRKIPKYMYNHILCAMALSEAYGMTGSHLFKDQAQKAVDFLVAAQNPGKGWRYSINCGDNDSSVTGWAVMTLKAAELSGLSFPQETYQGARAWFEAVTDKVYGHVGYVSLTEHMYPSDSFDKHETSTAMAATARIFMDPQKKFSETAKGCELLLRDLPRWETNAIDFHHWFQATQALYLFDGPKGPKWKAWNEPLKNVLVNNQVRDTKECSVGSWEPMGRWCSEGGRVYATAINALTLEVYYRSLLQPPAK